VSRDVEEQNRRLLRARDAMDRTYAEPLDVPSLARIARVSEAHFIRTFRATFGETPHRYLQRRRVERSVRDIVGVSPIAFRRGSAPIGGAVPTCFTMAWARPSSFGEASRSSSR
jgi:transcriptional regulator GlxA family with amidase domain